MNTLNFSINIEMNIDQYNCKFEINVRIANEYFIYLSYNFDA